MRRANILNKIKEKIKKSSILINIFFYWTLYFQPQFPSFLLNLEFCSNNMISIFPIAISSIPTIYLVHGLLIKVPHTLIKFHALSKTLQEWTIDHDSVELVFI